MNDNEKRVIKIGLRNAILLIVIAVIILTLGINVYAKAHGKPNLISSIEALIKKDAKEDTDVIAKDLFEKAVLAIRDGLYNEIDTNDMKQKDGIYYGKTNFKYSELKEKYEEIFTSEVANIVISMRVVDIDGIAYGFPVAGPGYSINDIKVNKINENNGELTYNATYVKSYADNKDKDEGSCQFKIKKVNNEYRIFATNYMNIDTLLENSNNTEEGLGWKASNITEGYLVKVYENKEITIEFNKDIYKVVKEPEGSGEMEMNVEYKVVGYSGEEKQVHVLQGRGTWPTVVVINTDGEVYIGKSNNMRYNLEDKTAIVSKCSIGNVLSIDDRKDEHIEVTTDKTKYTISWDTLSDFELIGKVKEEIERTNKIMLNSTPKVSRYSDTIVINGRGVIDRFIMQFADENCEVTGYTSYDNNGNIKIVNAEIIKNEQNDNQTNITENNNFNSSNSNSVKLLLGDANCDGVINNKDLTAIRKFVNGEKVLTEQGKINADVNDDDKVTEADVNVLMKYLSGEYSRLPQRTSGEEMTSKDVPGMSIKYPSNWDVTEIDKNTWGNRTGKATCTFTGNVNNIEVTVTTYDPVFNVGDYKSLIKSECDKYGFDYDENTGEGGYNRGSTDDNHLEWRLLYVSSNLRYYYHIIDKNVDNALKIQVEIDNPNGESTLPVERILDDIIIGTRVRSY